jgi:hypothetical protein
MTRATRTRCRMCGAAVVWIMSPSGPRLCDAAALEVAVSDTPETGAAPLVVLVDAVGGGVRRGYRATTGGRVIRGHLSHWATCVRAPGRRPLRVMS